MLSGLYDLPSDRPVALLYDDFRFSRYCQMFLLDCGVAPPMDAVSGVVKGGTHILWNGPNRWWIVESDARDVAPDLKDALG